MTDVVDRATLESQRSIDNALANLVPPPANEVTECIDCGNDIETQHKLAAPHATRCIYCQRLLEKNVKEYNR